MNQLYDCLILGAGPAGLSAAIYAGRYRRSTLVLEKGAVGGQITLTSEIENYPGQLTDASESGQTLTERMRMQAKRAGAGFVSAEIIKAELDGAVKRLTAQDGTVYEGKTLIIASGAHFKPIGCRNEERFIGSGISYCATCDGGFFQGLDVYVVGGGDSAVEEAIYLSKIARSVTVIHRRNELRAAKSIQERAFKVPNLHFLWDSVVTEANGEDVLTGLLVENVKTGEVRKIEASPEDGLLGLFGFIGMMPETGLFKDTPLLLENGYIRSGEDTHTSLPGVFAAGDIRTKKLRQVVTAASDGAVAAFEADQYLTLIS